MKQGKKRRRAVVDSDDDVNEAFKNARVENETRTPKDTDDAEATPHAIALAS